MTDGKSAPTLDDVAKRAGVSTATVSRCINNPERVVQGTRDRVQAAIQDLGYTPNFAARVMAAKRTFTIGAIIPTMENAMFARGLQAFQEALHARGYTLLVASSAYRADVEAEQVRALVSRGADGLLLIGHERDPDIYAYLQQQNVPALVAWTYSAETAPPSVGFDNVAAMAAIAKEVLDNGHRRLGVISGIRDGNDRASQRVEGVSRAIHLQGLDADCMTVVETVYGIENGAECFEQLMTSQTPPTAVLCINDVLAAGAISRAREMGFTVPKDVSITGFDDLELAPIVVPPLTTVHVPHRQMGTAAAHSLIAMVESKQSVASVCLETSVRLRGSLGKAP